MKTLYYFLLPISFFALLVVFIFLREDSKKTLNYKTEKLKRGTIQEKVIANGTINPISNIIIGTSVSGIIKEIYVDFNSMVKKGQVLAKIDPEPFIAQLEQAKANVLIAKSNLEKAKVSLLEAENNYKRYKKLFEEKLISESEYERYYVSYKSALAQIKEMEAKVAQANAQLKMAQTNLNYTLIRSPVNGIVISRNIEVGQTVTASFQTPTLFSIAEDLSIMQIHTSIDESDIGKIRNNQKVIFTVDAYPKEIYEGYVYQIRNAPITIQNVVTYEVIVRINNKDLKLKPGMTAQVSILTQKKENAFKVRNTALRVRIGNPPKEDKQSIWILHQNQPKRILVDTGISEDDYIEIISDELKEDMDVIVEVINPNEKKRNPLF